jgi:hypothetical protein
MPAWHLMQFATRRFTNAAMLAIAIRLAGAAPLASVAAGAPAADAGLINPACATALRIAARIGGSGPVALWLTLARIAMCAGNETRLGASRHSPGE